MGKRVPGWMPVGGGTGIGVSGMNRKENDAGKRLVSNSTEYTRAGGPLSHIHDKSGRALMVKASISPYGQPIRRIHIRHAITASLFAPSGYLCGCVCPVQVSHTVIHIITSIHSTFYLYEMLQEVLIPMMRDKFSGIFDRSVINESSKKCDGLRWG